jgi:hypothetical protein
MKYIEIGPRRFEHVGKGGHLACCLFRLPPNLRQIFLQAQLHIPVQYLAAQGHLFQPVGVESG